MKTLIILLLSIIASLTGCDMSCQNEAPAEHLSPDGQWKYVSFDRNCGATTRSNLQVSVLPALQPLPNKAANVFIADDDHGKTTFIAQPEWVSANKLRITYSSKARVFQRETSVGAIQIEYVRE